MTRQDQGDTATRGELLVTLRYGIRQSARLAEQLAGDAIVGTEARSLLGRLEAIRKELDAIAAMGRDERRADNDPFWSEFRQHQNGSANHRP